MGKIIGICGAPGSGKTTMSHLLRYKLQKITTESKEVCREYARHYMEKVGKIDEIHQQFFIYDGQLKSETQIKNNYNIAISDSPLLLTYIYGKILFNPDKKNNIAALVRLYELSLCSAFEYNKIYLLPPQQVFQDGIRSQNDEDAIKIFNNIKEFTDSHCPHKTVFLNGYNREEMEKWVDFIINDLIKDNIIKNDNKS